MRLAGMWAAVLAIAGALVTAGTVARSYLGAPSVQWRLSPVWLLWLVLAAGVFLLTRAAATGRARAQRRVARQQVRVEAHPGPVHVTITQVAGAAPTYTVRLVPHRDVGPQLRVEVA
jgi:hypothetical protein